MVANGAERQRRPANRLIKRSAIVIVILLFVLCIDLVSLAKIQLVNGEEYRQIASRQQLGDNSVQALRGTVYDRNMRVLAQSATAWKVFIDPSNIDDEVEAANVAKGLSKILGIDEQKILDKTKKTKSGYEKIKDKLDLETKNKVSEFVSTNKYGDIIGIQPDAKRYYPMSSLASTVIGFTGTDDIGLEGLENKYNKELTGTAGRIITAKNGATANMPIEYISTYDAKQGNSLVLTLDETIQRYLEDALEQALVDTSANAAYGVVMDVDTGAILAMTNQPDYDLNSPNELTDGRVVEAIGEMEKTDADAAAKFLGEARQAQWRNRSVSDTYEPGSVFKVITASAALEEGVVSESTTYTCTGVIQIANRQMHCHRRRGHGTQDFTHGLMNSCNPFFITVGQKLGAEKFYKYFEAFGFTESTGIDLTGEAAPVANTTYYTQDKLGIVELASESFGQSFQVTPIQMITAVCAIANGGKLMRPYIVDKQLDENGNIISKTEPFVRRQVISESTASRVTEMMKQVVSAGTGKNAYVAGYSIAGKTGTSQKLSKEGNYYVASFVCFAPADDPEIAILITIDEPKGEINGGQIAAPVAAEVIGESMVYLNIEPKYSESEQQLVDISVPALTGKDIEQAKKLCSDSGLSLKILGDGDSVTRQIPSLGQTVPSGGVIVAYTSDGATTTVTVPDFSGMTVTMAKKTANDLGLNIKLSGNALRSGDVISYKQSVESGTEVEYGSVITVYFKAYSGVSDYTG